MRTSNDFNTVVFHRKIVGSQRGFSLLEIIIALAILGFLLSGLFNGYGKIRDFDDYVENRLVMADVEQAFYTFVQVNGFMPCPDTNGDGLENRETSAPFECSDKNGTLPYLDLGVRATDVWGQAFHYSVNNRSDASGTLEIGDPDKSASYFSNQTPPGFAFNTPPFGTIKGDGNYTICAQSATVCDGTTASADMVEQAAIAVVISYGVNGGNTWGGGAVTTQETENRDDDNYFWQSSSGGSDDQLIWFSGYDVKYAYIKSAGALQ